MFITKSLDYVPSYVPDNLWTHTDLHLSEHQPLFWKMTALQQTSGTPFSLSPSNYSNLTASSSLPVVTFNSILLQIRPWTHFLWFQNLNAKFQSIDALANAYSTYYSSLKTSSFHLLSSCGKEGALILSFIIMSNVSCLKNKQTVFRQKVDICMKK